MDINRRVNFKSLAFLAAVLGLAWAAASGQTPAAPVDPNEAVVEAEAIPPEVLASAVDAVNKLGKEIELGRYRASLERMNPLWKNRTAERKGGIKALEDRLEGVAAELVRQGVTIISSRADGTPIPYEVKPGRKSVRENGATVEKVRHTMWLVLVPTVTRSRHFPPGAQRATVIDSHSFQVAVSEKDKLDWTFIAGADLNVGDLRGLFPTLPKNMVLPPVKNQEVR